MRHYRLAAALLPLILFSMPAAASDDSKRGVDTDRVSVSYADLNLDSEAGAARLYSRFKHAAEEFCGINFIHVYRELSYTRKARQCYADTLDEFVAKIDSELVEKLHSS